MLLIIDLVGLIINLGADLVHSLLFPTPVGDGTLPPYQIAPPDVYIPPPGGMCVNTRYRVYRTLKGSGVLGDIPEAGVFSPTAQVGLFELYSRPSDTGIVVLFGNSSRTIEGIVYQPVDTSSGYYRLEGRRINLYRRSDNVVIGSWAIELRFERFDGLPDTCGDAPLPEGSAGRTLPVPKPVKPPIPFPLPLPLPLPKPLPVPIPPKPLPPTPKPPNPIKPPPSVEVDIEVNFDFSTVNNNITINCSTGTGTLPLEPFQSLARLLYAILWEVREIRSKMDRMSEQIDCLHSLFCVGDREFYTVNLGEIGYSKNGLFSFALQGRSDLRLESAYIVLPEIANAAGRRNRKNAPRLFSNDNLGYYALQYDTGSYGSLTQVRFRNQHIPTSKEVKGIAIYLEPQAGNGNLFAVYSKSVSPLS